MRRVPRGGEKDRQGEGQDVRHPRELQARLLLEVHHGVAGQGTYARNPAPCAHFREEASGESCLPIAIATSKRRGGGLCSSPLVRGRVPTDPVAFRGGVLQSPRSTLPPARASRGKNERPGAFGSRHRVIIDRSLVPPPAHLSHDLQSKSHECPECQVPSPFVVPSRTLVTDRARKERLVSKFRRSPGGGVSFSAERPSGSSRAVIDLTAA